METPLSTRRLTRSQTLINSSSIPISRKMEDSEKSVTKTRRNAKQQEDRPALIDITNDSPIVGLAMGSVQTPSSAIAKQRSIGAKNSKNSNTPGSGEALLRGQVKTLLQRVEEEAVLSKLPLESRTFLHLQGFDNSPIGLLAPTNTPQILNFSDTGDPIDDGLISITPLSIVEEGLNICQVANEIFDGKKQESLESQKSLNRSLLQDFSEKSDNSESSSECSSVLTYQGVGECRDNLSSLADDDNASIWSIQVNASVDDEEEEEIVQGEKEDYYLDKCEEEEEEEIEEDDGGLIGELCEGMSNVTVNDKTMPKFAGKHTRFVYNSDDELVAIDCEESEDLANVSPSVMRLKGLPTPKGKHLRFPVGEDEL